MDFSRLLTSWGSVGLVLLATAAIFAVVVLYTRLAGPRTLATMSSFDFAASVAIGSTIATVANLGTPLIHGVITLAVLYLAQVGASLMRRRQGAARALDNSPLMLMRDGTPITENLRTARVSEAELTAQLRRAGVTSFGQVAAAVLETSGEVSVLRTEPGAEFDRRLLAGVRS